MANNNWDPESMQDRIDELEDAFRQDSQSVQEEEKDLSEKEDRTDEAEKAEEAEIEEGEAEGNLQEIEDAEDKMQRILEFLKDEETEADDIEAKLKEELEIELEEADIIEEMEEGLDSQFAEAVSRLEQYINSFEQAQGTKALRKKHFQDLESTLQEIRYSAEIFRRILEKDDELLGQLQETEDEGSNFEALLNRMEQELGISRDELREIMNDVEKIGDPQDIEEAQQEGQEFQQLKQHLEDEESGVRQLEDEIEAEINELESILGEDQKILR